MAPCWGYLFAVSGALKRILKKKFDPPYRGSKMEKRKKWESPCRGSDGEKRKNMRGVKHRKKKILESPC